MTDRVQSEIDFLYRKTKEQTERLEILEKDVRCLTQHLEDAWKRISEILAAQVT
jgi:hypothetical protein